VRRLRLATRGSTLARWQTEWVADAVRAAAPDVECELVVVSTEGDRRRDVPLDVIGGKGVFVKEVQAAVLDGRADVAVHSAKDVPAIGPDELVIAAVPPREDPRDVLVGLPLDRIPPGGEVATGSRRRAVQITEVRPDIRIVGLRGNMHTRLAKADDHHAVVAAAAALRRLGLEDRIAEVLDVDRMIPQVGQGCLAVECRTDDAWARELLAAMDHEPSRTALDAERAFLAELGGDCDLPAGAHAELVEEGVRLRAILAEDGEVRRVDLTDEDGAALGRTAAVRLRAGDDAGPA
jgi:hydroxymethylbilane synthase